MEHPADAHYFRELDRIERIEQAQERHAAYLLSDLLSKGGSDEVDDESVATPQLVADLRAAYLLCQTGARDAALTAFCDAFRTACGKAADDEARDAVNRALRGGR